ncbi:hypothetical protein M569_02243, partial [Genlisea aurea]
MFRIEQLDAVRVVTNLIVTCGMAMANASQSIRYIGHVTATGSGNLEELNRILADLSVRGNPKDGAAASLRRHVEEQARDLSWEAFSRFMDQLYDRITNLLESNEVSENLGALRAIDELIDVGIGENAVKVAKISSYIRTAFEAKRESETLLVASKVLGHLARAGGAMTADEVEQLVKIALDWLREDRVEHRRFAAVLILKELAENASTVFNVHVPEFVEAIWVALRDPKLEIREWAVKALRACLRVIEKRETRWRVQWYYRMFEATQDGLGKNAPVHSIHGSLLAVGELLRNTGEFMMSRYREVAEIVLRYLEHRDRLICMKHILHVLKIPAEAPSGFIALGEMAAALDGELTAYLPTITAHLRDAIAPRRGQPLMEALACVGNISKAMGPPMEPHVRSLLDAMFYSGLSTSLVEALENITASIPSLLPTIQARLLECISGALSRNGPGQSRSIVPITRTNSTAATLQVYELSGSALVQLALQTLSHFNFKGHDLLAFARESVVIFLEDEDGFRQSIFFSLRESREFDDFLAQADCLTAIFAALNDEVSCSDIEVREHAIYVAGRLSGKNPAYVLPALRRHLIQLLTYLKQSADSKCREESAKLLGCLIRNCERLTIPYIAPIHKGGFAMRQYIPELMPLIVEALLDGAAAIKREVAVTTLGQVVQSTGYVITPYTEYPLLLGLLLKLLNGELAWSTRREVLKVLGIMGALDPHAHKRNKLSLPGSHGEVGCSSGDPGQHIGSIEGLPMDLWPSFATSEDYYSTVAISSLMRIFRDPSLSSYHQKVVGSLIFIFKVLPELLHTVRTCDDNLKEYITWKLGTLVSIVRQHVRKYLPELFSLISELWSSFSLPVANRPAYGSPILHLLEQLCLALNDEFRTHLPFILPSCIQVLTDAERFKDYTYVIDILHTLQVFGALIRIFKLDASVEVRRAAVKTLTKLIPRVQVTGHISTLVHHLKLVLDGYDFPFSFLVNNLTITGWMRNDELRKDAVDALCCLARAVGDDFSIFVPSIHKLLEKHRLKHRDFEEIEGRLERREPLILGSSGSQKPNCQLPVERSTKEDWAEWMRHFSIELLKESPSPALRTCAKLAQLQAEFMEHDERPLPIDIRLLGALAEKCRAFAKALHYKEMEFEGAQSNRMDGNPVAVVEALIHINNQLHQHEAAVGILTYAQQHLAVQLKESWYEKLQRWDDALKAYTIKASQAPTPALTLDATLGRMRCLAALARWEELNDLCRLNWTSADHSSRLEMAPMAASAAWNMGDWEQMSDYVSRLDDGDESKLRASGSNAATGDGSSSGTFFRAVLMVRCGKVLESYERAYSNMVRIQQLSELEEAILAVRSLVLPPTEDAETWIKFASLCRKSGRISQARSTLTKLLQFDPESTPEHIRYHGDPQVILAYLKYQWSLGEDHRRKDAFKRLKELAMDLSRYSVSQQPASSGVAAFCSTPLVARIYLKLGTWQWALSPEIRDAFGNATHYAAKWAKAWHKWALFNTAVMSYYTLRGSSSAAAQFVIAAVTGYFHSIACAGHAKGVDDSLQDILRLLTLWFNHGATTEVQALMYPLLVACKSISKHRKQAAQEVVDKVRQHSGVLVHEALLVSTELIRVAILWHEMWHEALEEASRLYFGEHNIEGMLKVLEPLHEMLEKGVMRNDTTNKEKAFIQAYRHELLEAYECCMKYKRTGRDAELTQVNSWKHANILITLAFDSPVVTIASFAPQLVVITSKQRPRKLTIYGSDGEEYAFLLKGHEDLRQDERVMQLFGLVNTLLGNSRKTAEKDLSIQRYAVIPLSPNSGLIGWVPNCDTLHHLIKEYRDARKITLNLEHKLMLGFAPDYDHLPLIAKVLWLKSRTSEVWLDRRTNYTRSLAVMSMVGYLLGLGDRHPSNLMLHRYSGKILHIDFGDCFEASMNREKFPEKVPFRLTRMLVKAMEVSGIEGNFRSTCENVMQVLRSNKDSVMAMME